MSFSDALILGVFCNFLVCIAVWISFAAKTPAGKAVGLFFPPPLCGGFFRFFIANTAMLRYNIYDRFVDEFILY